MINPFHEINWHPDTPAIRKFGLTLLIGFAVIAVLFFLINLSRTSLGPAFRVPCWILGIGAAVWLLTLILPKAALPVYYVWYGISACIGLIVSNLILTFFFYLLFTPFSMVFRILSGRDPLRLRKPKAGDSQWIQVTSQTDVKRYLKQY